MKKIFLIISYLFISIFLVSCVKSSQNEIIFKDLTVEYNGEYQTIVPKNIPEGVEFTYEYEFNEKPKNVGTYEISINVQLEQDHISRYTARLTIVERVATIIVSDAYEINGVVPTPEYTIYNLIEGESLNEELWFSNKKLMYSWENPNYTLNVIRGTYLSSGELINTYDEFDFSTNIANGDLANIGTEIMPFTFKGIEKIQGKKVTSITFTFGGKIKYTDENSNPYYADEFYLPIYKINENLSESKDDCTIENGKKMLVNITDLVNSANRGDEIIVSNLNISVGDNELLVFGDTDMAFTIMCIYNNEKFQILRSIFNNPIYSAHSALIRIDGVY